MSDVKSSKVIAATADRLRQIVFLKEAGDFIGSEDSLVAELACSRNTVRQVARLLERDGLLRVRRGINGGYFGARPDAGTVEGVVATYLNMLDIEREDVIIIASALYVATVRKASRAPANEIRSAVDPLYRDLLSFDMLANFGKVLKFEERVRSQIFALAKSTYVKLIFDINIAYSQRVMNQGVDDDSAQHEGFVPNWRDAKLLELSALRLGDAEQAELAARHSRILWEKRVSTRFT